MNIWMRDNMRRVNRILAMTAILCLRAQGQDTLPGYLAVELKQLQETWHILDLFAERVWPGWNNYRDVPFLIAYPNGVRLLVGHPDPPKNFSAVAGLSAGGKDVFLDRSREIALPLKAPLLGGGGPVSLGTWRGKPVRTVSLRLFYLDPELAERRDSLERGSGKVPWMPAALQYASENQILINVHELFHCYQETVFRSRHGNLRYNTDANYAVYSEIEGLALEKAFLTVPDDSLKIFLVDFLTAREMKRKSMTAEQQAEESGEEVSEGTAVYAEAMLLRLIGRDYAPEISASDDPYYRNFAGADSYFELKLEQLREIRGETLESRGRSYTYGCFQSLALSRLAGGWQKGFFESGRMLDQLIADVVGSRSGSVPAEGNSLKFRYGYDALLARHAGVIAGRDRALALIEGRKGRAYVINFKETGEYLQVKANGPSYRIGLITVFPNGIDSMRVAEVTLRGTASPIIQDQLFYLRWVDTGPGEEGCTIQCSRHEEGGIYYNAVVRTGGFTLTAPKLRVSTTPGRVKITVLSKVKVE
jgi:hypothetical protein